MVLKQLQFLSNRERQIVDIVYRETEVTARRVEEALPDAPGYSAVRSMLRRLVEKGVVSVDTSTRQHKYKLQVSRQKTQAGELRRLVRSFFGGSHKAAILNLLQSGESELSDAELAEIQQLIEQHRGQNED